MVSIWCIQIFTYVVYVCVLFCFIQYLKEDVKQFSTDLLHCFLSGKAMQMPHVANSDNPVSSSLSHPDFWNRFSSLIKISTF